MDLRSSDNLGPCEVGPSDDTWDRVKLRFYLWACYRSSRVKSCRLAFKGFTKSVSQSNRARSKRMD